MAALATLWAASLLGVQTAYAQLSGITYTLSPVGTYPFFEQDEESGLENAILYGGALGFGFGQYLEAEAVYQRGRGLGTAFDPAGSDPDLAGLGELALGRQTDLDRYGGRVRLNLGRFTRGAGGFVPYVAGGAGILRFEPGGVEASESIYVTGGAGITASALNRYTLTLGAQALAYRYNPGRAFFSPAELGGRVTEQRDVLVPAARAALQFYLGGRTPERETELDRAFRRQFSGGLGGARLFVEPFYGRIEFAEELVGRRDGQFYRDQNLAGLNAGVELGPYVGVRGFYWRGTSGREDVFDAFGESFQPIALYGGELNLRFGSSVFGTQSSFTPYGIIGGGYLDVLSDYANVVEPPPRLRQSSPDDRYFATLGGGLEVPLGSALKLQGDVRSLFMSTQQAENVSDPDAVHANLMYAAGIEFNFGGREATPEELIEARGVERERLLREETRADLNEREALLLDEVQRLRARLETVERRDRVAQLRAAGLSTEEAEELALLEQDARRDTVARRGVRRQTTAGVEEGATGGVTDRVVRVPVPETGEIYVRIGEPGGAADVSTSYAPPTVVAGQGQQAGGGGVLSREEIARIVGEELQRARDEQALSRNEISSVVEQAVRARLAQIDDESAAVAARNEQIRRLEDQIEDLRDDLQGELNEAERRALRRARGDEAALADERAARARREESAVPFSYTPSRIIPTTGFAFGGPGRFLVGVRGDYPNGYQGFGSERGFRFLPEAAIGIGEGIGVNLIANGIYDFSHGFASRYLSDGFAPYVGVGTGVTTETALGVNLMAGLEYKTQGRGDLFIDYSTMDFLDYNRILVGYRLDF